MKFHFYVLVLFISSTIATKTDEKTNNLYLSQNTSNVQEIIQTCHHFLFLHTMIGEKWGLPFHFYRPSLEKYGPDQWLWDSGSHMIVWSHLNVSNSIADLRTMLQMQQPDGRIPEIINWGPQTLEDIALAEFQYSSSKYVDLTQMPVLPFSLRAIWNKTKDSSLLKEFLPKLVDYFQWWSNTRETDNDGLVLILHPWESGMDASPVYDLSFGITNPNPDFWDIYPKFIELVVSYRWEYGWNQSEILGRKSVGPELLDSWFKVKDVGVNAVYAAGWGVLGDLALELGDQNLSNYCKQKQSVTQRAIIEKCWDSDLNRFVSLYVDFDGVEKKSTVETAQSLFPLLLDLPKDLIQSIVETQVLNASKFWLPFPIPSVSKSAAQFTPVFTVDLMWRGPTWPIQNWFVMEGLMKHGYTSYAQELLNRWIDLYKLSGVWEQYNPETGENYGVEGLGMSTLIVDWLYRLGRA
eukprot:TRINITY_DN8322_c0_g1_i2.p1 TRINITY_DN8322_c0_g1~~TRINITY_DN8322_c0_g1_i2.p1  ORF type:complete len:465 (-),score=75.46 TRINITY_DN8322_c0_g1_i2:20-1414(-)